MKRLSIILEDYDDSKKVCASLLAHEKEPVTSTVLKQSGVMFTVEEVRGPLFHYRLDDNKSYVDLQLRTKAEISEWVDNKPFAETVRNFLESGGDALRLSLDRQHAFLAISRQEQ